MPISDDVWYNIYEQLFQNYIFPVSTFSPIWPQLNSMQKQEDYADPSHCGHHEIIV